MRNWLKAFVLVLDELAIVGLVIYILWRFGVNISTPVIVISAAGAGAWLLVVHRILLSISRRRHIGGKEGMIGRRGKVVTPLKPEGTIKIRGELWKASSPENHLEVHDEVLVVEVKGLVLVVKKATS